MIVGIIGGSGISAALLDPGSAIRVVETIHGAAEVTCGTLAGVPVAFVARHGRDHTLLPHQVNYRANALALKTLGAERVLATSACGSLRDDLPPGTLALLTDFIDFTRTRPWTLAPDLSLPPSALGPPPSFHVDMTAPYCPRLRGALAEAADAEGVVLRDGALYLCVEGPRYETHAEIRLFQSFGADLVGMTGVPEVTLARELGQCYASVAIVTNAAAGLSAGPLSHDEVVAAVTAAGDRLTALFRAALPRIAALPPCDAHPNVKRNA